MNYSVLLLVLTIAGYWAKVARYDNYQVFRFIPKTDAEVEQLKTLENNGLDLDFWKSPIAPNMSVDIMVPPHKLAQIHEFISDTQIIGNVMINNVQHLIDESSPIQRNNAYRQFGWTQYQRLANIYFWLEDLAYKFPQVTLLNIGKTYEGRDIKGVHVSFKYGNKGVFLEAGIHAREWIAPATVTYILNELLFSQDPDVRNIAENYDWYIFPVTNPDGYEYTHTTNRGWRKTRQPYTQFCVGADPNRNWGFHWNGGGASSSPCNELFAGFSPFSEPETRVLAQYINSIHSNLVGYIAFHSYSQLLLIPYGYTSAHLDNYDVLLAIGRKAIQSLSRRYGTRYVVGNIVETIYIAAGGSMDWVKGTYRTPITYTYELRDTGRYGFFLPPEQIIPTGAETLDSIVTLMQEARARGY